MSCYERRRRRKMRMKSRNQNSPKAFGELKKLLARHLENLPRILMPPSGEGVYARRMLQAGKPAAYMSMFLFNDEEYQIYRDT